MTLKSHQMIYVLDNSFLESSVDVTILHMNHNINIALCTALPAQAPPISLCTVTSGSRGRMSSIVWSRVRPCNWLITSHGLDVKTLEIMPINIFPVSTWSSCWPLGLFSIFANCLPSIAGNCWYSWKMAFRLIRERREKRRVAKLDEIFQVLQYTIQIQIEFLVKYKFRGLPGINTIHDIRKIQNLNFPSVVQCGNFEHF